MTRRAPGGSNAAMARRIVVGVLLVSAVVGMTGGGPATADDNEAPGAPAAIRSITGGSGFVCAILDTGRVKCWGENADGQLGQADTSDRGDEPGELGDALPA